MAHRNEGERAKREATPGGATGGGGIGADAVSPDSPGNDQGGIVGSGAVWHRGAAKDFAGSKPGKGEAEAAPAGGKKRPDYPDELVVPDDNDR